MSSYFIVSPEIVGLSDEEVKQIEKANKEQRKVDVIGSL